MGEGSFGLHVGMEPPMALTEDQPSPLMAIMPPPPRENPVTTEAVERGNNGEVRVSPRNRCRHHGKTPSSPLCIIDFKWVRDDVLKFHSLITFPLCVGALWHQPELAKPGDARKMTLVA